MMPCDRRSIAEQRKIAPRKFSLVLRVCLKQTLNLTMILIMRFSPNVELCYLKQRPLRIQISAVMKLFGMKNI